MSITGLDPRIYEFIFCPIGFAYGAVVGSFLNVCIYRLPHESSITSPPSHCPWCRTKLRWFDLVPLLSQALLRARCRYCGQRISWRYFSVELFTAVSFAAVVATSHEATVMLQGLVLVSCLIATFFIDLDHFIIPDEVNWTLALGGVLPNLLQMLTRPGTGVTSIFINPLDPASPSLAIPNALLGALVAGGALVLVRDIGGLVFRKEAMGWGDVKLAAAFGANLIAVGSLWDVLTFYILSFVIGAAISVGLIALFLRKTVGALPLRAMLIGAVLAAAALTLVRVLTTMALGGPLSGGEALPFSGSSLDAIVFYSLSILLGAIVAIVISARHTGRQTEYIPFGPMLAVGAYLTWFLGPGLITPLLITRTLAGGR